MAKLSSSEVEIQKDTSPNKLRRLLRAAMRPPFMRRHPFHYRGVQYVLKGDRHLMLHVHPVGQFELTMVWKPSESEPPDPDQLQQICRNLYVESVLRT